MEIFTEENLVGVKTAPATISRPFAHKGEESQVSLIRNFLSDPGSKNKIGVLGGWGQKNEPDKSIRHHNGTPFYVACNQTS